MFEEGGQRRMKKQSGLHSKSQLSKHLISQYAFYGKKKNLVILDLISTSEFETKAMTITKTYSQDCALLPACHNL